MPLPDRPVCPGCAKPVDRMQHSVGVFAAYPCNCWLTVEAARQAVRTWRER